MIPILRQPSHVLAAHERFVNAMTVSPDGKTLATVGGDKSFVLWDLESREEKDRIPRTEGTIHQLAFSPNGSKFAWAGWGGSVRVFDLATRRTRVLDGFRNSVTGVAFSPDGKTLAAIGSALEDQMPNAPERMHALIWDVATGDVQFHLEGDKGHPHHVAFVDGGQDLLVADSAGTINLFDLSNGKLRERFVTSQGGPLGVTTTGTGKLLATGGYDRTVKLWNVNGQCLATLSGQKTRTSQVAFSRDGNLVASAGGDIHGDEWSVRRDEVRIWDIAKALPRAIVRGPRGSLAFIAFADGDKTLITAGVDGIIRFWNLPATPGQMKVPIVPPITTERAGTYIENRGGKIRRQGSEITFVDLSGTAFADNDLAVVGALRWLRELRLDKTKITDEGLRELRKLSLLEELSIRQTQVTEAGARSFHQALPECMLTWSDDGLVDGMINQNDNLVDAIREYGGRVMKEPNGNIVEVHLGRRARPISDAGLRYLRGMTTLKVLGAFGDPNRYAEITDLGLGPIKDLNNLENLSLGWTKITDDGLAQLIGLRELKTLDLRGTGITDLSLEYLVQLPKLDYLAIRDTKVTPAGIKSLRERLPNCKIYDK